MIITGTIDIVFKSNDKYYFADWKSNIMDKNEEVEDKVRDVYDMQYKLYFLAVVQWLLSVKPDNNQFSDVDFLNDHMGGFYFFFLRRISDYKFDKSLPDNGIFSRFWGTDDLNSEKLEIFKEEIVSAIKRKNLKFLTRGSEDIHNV